jgi:hypothetical protein
MNPTTTTTHPASQNLTAVDGTFTGDVSVGDDLTVDSGTLFVDASENKVGIGTTTVRNNLDFGVTSNNDHIIALRDNNVSRTILGLSNGYGVRVGSPSDGTSTENMFEVGEISASDGTTYQNTRFSVDYAGRVKTPNQPSFHAVSTSSGFTHDSIMVFNTALLNVGSHYNTSNGKFTAPVAGVYFFYHHNIGTSASTVIRVKVYYNDSVFSTYKQIATRQDTSQGNDYAEGHITFAVSLSANDTIKLATFADDSSSGIYNDNSGGQGFNYFGGYLIG